MGALYLPTERLVLREFERGDEHAIYRYRSDPEVTRWEPNARTTTPQECARFVERVRSLGEDETREVYFLAVIRRADNALIGEVILFPIDCETEAGIGYNLARACWGQGFATEAARGMLRFGFQELGKRRIAGGTAAGNLASRRVLEKLGMRRDDSFIPRLNPAADPARSVAYVLSREEWLAGGA